MPAATTNTPTTANTIRSFRDTGAADYRAMPARIGLGLAALGRPGYLNIGHGADIGDDRSVGALRARAHEVMDAAYEAGVRHFDAARSYGRAEEFLGGWLRSRGPGGGVVRSKWGYGYTAGRGGGPEPPGGKHPHGGTFPPQPGG